MLADWRKARAKDYDAWIIPSALLMTVSFGLLMTTDVTKSEPTYNVTKPDDWLLNWLSGHTYDGSAFEAFLRGLVAHLYTFALITSAMSALRCVNDFTQSKLLNANTPPEKYWDVHQIRVGIHPQLQKASMSQTPELLYADRAKRLLQCGNTWDNSYQTLSLWLFGGRNEAAYFSSVYRLSFGIICGTFHSCGLSRALVVLIPCICYPLEMRYRSWERYEAPYNPV